MEEKKRRRAVVVAAIVGLAGFAMAGVAVVVSRRLQEPTPQEYFDRHRADLDRVVELVDQGKLDFPAGDAYYPGALLPKDLRYLSATDRVSMVQDGSLFIPRWTRIVDDAGGYWWTDESPRSRDMYGLTCTNPIQLDTHWWACGL